MNKDNEFEQIKESYEGKRLYRAKNIAYNFDLFDDIWRLGLKDKLNLEWMYDVGYEWQTFIDLRVLLAVEATMHPFTTVKTRMGCLRCLGNQLTLPAFKLAWLSMSNAKRQTLATVISSAVKYAQLKQFEKIHLFAQENRPASDTSANILDIEKGVYSDFEFNSIKQGLRYETDEQIRLTREKNYGLSSIRDFTKLVAGQLMNALMRRPTQLAQLKWCDVLPIGQKFSDYRRSKRESVPIYEYLFSDVECVHIRTFKGKDGEFRAQAERNSQRIEPELSSLLLLYRKQYKNLLNKVLLKQGINLSSREMEQLILQCPIFPEEQLFKVNFKDKTLLFKSLGFMSEAFHKSPSAMRHVIERLNNKMNLKSDRISDSKLKFSNNRLRHSVLTSGAQQGLTRPYLAKITGVTESAVDPYLDLDVNGRVAINQAFVEHDVLKKFGRVSVKELLKQDGFVVRNEFDEEVGLYSNVNDCTSCATKLGAPMGCYPCSNFRPKENANHQQYLDKARAKYELNKAKGNKVTLKKLRTIILYIKATIKVCDEMKLIKSGGSS